MAIIIKKKRPKKYVKTVFLLNKSLK